MNVILHLNEIIKNTVVIRNYSCKFIRRWWGNLLVRVREKTMETVDWHPRKLRFQQREKSLQGRVLVVTTVKFSGHSSSMPEIHSIPLLFKGSLAVDNGNYLRSKIISGPFWGSFAVWGSFVVGDHLRYCTDLMSLMTSSLVTIAITVFNVCHNVYSE